MEVKSLKVIVDTKRCVSSGNCADLVPAVFTQDDNTGVVMLLQERPDASLAEVVRKAALCCPSQAISIEET
jgi:ferredoxin